MALHGLGRYEESIIIYDRTIKFNPDTSEAWSARVMALYGLGRYEEAINSYDHASELNPNDESILYARSCTLDKLGKSEESTKILEVSKHSDEEML